MDFTLFGRSDAFSVGKENGFDFLQLPQNKECMAVYELKTFFAHDLHHFGFRYLRGKTLPKNINQDDVLLAVSN